MKNTNPFFQVSSVRFRLATLLLLVVISFHVQAQFIPSAIPNKYFPKPVATEPLPTSTKGALAWPTFYNERNNGSCYSVTDDFDPAIPGNENIYVWAICHKDVAGYDNAFAYEIIDATGTIVYRGTQYLGGDIANLQVGMYKDNGGNFNVVIAYWKAGGFGTGTIELATYQLSTSGAPTIVGTPATLYTCATTNAQHINLDCHDLSAFVVAWEDQGVSCFMKPYYYDPSISALVSAAYMPFGSSSSRLPDVALSHNTTMALPNIDVHCAYVETAGATTSIVKGTVDFAALLGMSGTFVVEDVEILSTSFGAYWDDFSLRLDAPDHYTSTTPSASNWAYAYFDDDNNKIKVRMCNLTATPAYNTYVINDGSMPIGGTSPVVYLDNITNAGNNFPTITYLPNGVSAYVGWYTNYDPTIGPAPAINNPLYSYTTQTLGYVSVVIDDMGQLRTKYNGVDNDRLTNRIGLFINPSTPNTNMYYPKICFSKNNDCAQLFALFSSHDSKVDLIWNWYSAAFLGTYYEKAGLAGAYWPLINTVNSSIGYSSVFGGSPTILAGTSVFLSQKQVDWYPALSPLFRKASNSIASSTPLSICGNPFSATSVFQLKGGDATKWYTATLYAIDGKKIGQWYGNITSLNLEFKKLPIEQLSNGFFNLHISNATEARQVFRLIKQ
jgi:hypothetical protein